MSGEPIILETYLRVVSSVGFPHIHHQGISFWRHAFESYVACAEYVATPGHSIFEGSHYICLYLVIGSGLE